MGAIFGILALVCVVAAVIGWIWLLVVIFQDGGVLWGLGSLIIVPFVGVIYVLMNWGERVKKPILLVILANVGAWVCNFLG